MHAETLQSKAQSLGWPDLRALWDRLNGSLGDFDDWDGKGNAFQYLIIRGFELSSDVGEVKYPFRVPFPYRVAGRGASLEELDGFVRIGQLGFLLESKNYVNHVDFEPIAKLRDKLARRPGGTIGSVFAKEGFTTAAKVLVGYVAPQAILLWDGNELERCLKSEDFASVMLQKYHYLQAFGHQDFNIGQDIEAGRLKQGEQQ